MKITLNIGEDAELRAFIKDVIKGQVMSIVDEQIETQEVEFKETWSYIFDAYELYIDECNARQKTRLDLDKWLEENYEVPTKK